MNFRYEPKGVCPKLLEFDLAEDGSVHDLVFTGGCNGNLKAIGKLVDGMPADKVIELLQGNRCGLKNTSCADQLTKALELARKELDPNRT